MNEIKNDLLEDLGMETSSDALDFMAEGENRYLKDFRLNMKSIYKSSLTEEQVVLVALACAYNAKNKNLKNLFTNKAEELEIGADKISDAIACASLLSANNVFYRFRHFVDGDDYDKMPAKFRMNIMSKSTIGKELFELISLAISAINGCEVCVSSHEKSLKGLEVSKENIWDSIRIASMIQSANVMM